MWNGSLNRMNHLFSCKFYNFIFIYSCIKLYLLYVLHFHSPFISWWTFKFNPFYTYEELSSHKHVCAYIVIAKCQARNSADGLCVGFISSLLRKLQTEIHGGYTIYIPDNNACGFHFPHIHSCLFTFVFLMVVTVTGVW